MRYKTGLLPSPSPPKLALGEYLLPLFLPPLPPTFGNQNMFPSHGWGMLGNDKLGDCTVAGAMHCEMIWCALANKLVHFTTLDAEDDYYAITGNKDSGASMADVARYWQGIGFRDSHANRHKILAYMAVDPTNLDHIDMACYLFGAVGLGVIVGENEERAFQNQQPWAYSTYESTGYHYVPMIGKTAQYRQVVTWGGLQDVTEDWLQNSVKEVVAVLSDEDVAVEGFNIEALKRDLEALGG